MTRIDRYLIVLYLRVLVICFLSLSGLLIVVHIFTNLDELIRFSEQQNASLATVLVEYYGPYLLWLFERLSGLIALLALLFVVAWLNRTHEFTAMMAAGVTKRRVVRPLLIASAVVILGAAATRELALPAFQDRLDRNPQDLTGDLPRPIKPTFDQDAVALLQGGHLLPIKREIVGPFLKIQGGVLAERVGTKVVAETAHYEEANGDHQAGYRFRNVSAPRDIAQMPSVSNLQGKPLLLTAKDHPWLAADECFLVSDVEYELLRGGSAWRQFASTAELIRHLRGEHATSAQELQVQVHQRFLRPALDWTLLLLGIPVLLSRPDRHMFWVAGACLGVVAGFSAVVLGLSAVGSSSNLLSPMLACWLPLLAFFPWGWAKTANAMET